VRKLRAPRQPELAIGSIDEHGRVYLAAHAQHVGVTHEYLEKEKKTQLDGLKRRRAAYTMARPPVDAHDRVVIVVDDGIATGSTMIAALKSAREQKPQKLIAAVAVAPMENVEKIRPFDDEVVCLAAPPDFYSVGQFFDEFPQVSDDEVVALLRVKGSAVEVLDPPVSISVEGVTLHGDLSVPVGGKGIVVFAHGSGSSHLSPRNQHVAEVLHRHGMGTLLFDLLTPEEDRVYENRFDVGLLGRRLAIVTRWLSARPEVKGLPVGYFGASTGAAAALIAAAQLGSKIACVVSRGGRPDLAMESARRVSAPTLFIVGAMDTIVLDLNHKAYDVIPGVKELSIIPGASHLFEEPGTLDEAALRAADWFCRYLEPSRIVASSHGVATAVGPRS